MEALASDCSHASEFSRRLACPPELDAVLPDGEACIQMHQLFHVSAALQAQFKKSMPAPGTSIRRNSAFNSLEKRFQSAQTVTTTTTTKSSIHDGSHPSSSSASNGTPTLLTTHLMSTEAKRPRAPRNRSKAAIAAAAAAAAAAAGAGSVQKETIPGLNPKLPETSLSEATRRGNETTPSPLPKNLTAATATKKDTIQTSIAKEETMAELTTKIKIPRTTSAIKKETAQAPVMTKEIGEASTVKEETAEAIPRKETSEITPVGKKTAEVTPMRRETVDATLIRKETAGVAAIRKETAKVIAVRKETPEAIAVRKETEQASAVEKEMEQATAIRKETEQATAIRKETPEAIAVRKETVDAAPMRKETAEATATRKETVEATEIKKETAEAFGARRETVEAPVMTKEKAEATANRKETTAATKTRSEAAIKPAIPTGGRFTLGTRQRDIVRVQDTWDVQCLRIMEAFRSAYVVINKRGERKPLSAWFWVPELLSEAYAAYTSHFVSHANRKPLFFSHVVAKLTDKRYPYAGLDAFATDVRLVLNDTIHFFAARKSDESEDVVYQAREMLRTFETLLSDVKREPIRPLNAAERADVVSNFCSLTPEQHDKILDFVRGEIGGDESENIKLEIQDLTPQRQWELLALIKQEFEKIPGTCHSTTATCDPARVTQPEPVAKRQRVDPITPAPSSVALRQQQQQQQEPTPSKWAYARPAPAPCRGYNKKPMSTTFAAEHTPRALSMPKTPANGFSMLDEADDILEALGHGQDMFESPGASTDVPGSSASSSDFPTSSPEFPYSPMDTTGAAAAAAAAAAGHAAAHGSMGAMLPPPTMNAAGAHAGSAVAQNSSGSGWPALPPPTGAWDASSWADWYTYGPYGPSGQPLYRAGPYAHDPYYSAFPSASSAPGFYAQAPFAADDPSSSAPGGSSYGFPSTRPMSTMDAWAS